MDECLLLREEEAVALDAIYGDRFKERIANSVWTVSLDLPFLSEKPPKNVGGARNGGAAAHVRGVCKFYLKNQGCRFGHKCRFRHELPGNERSGAGPSDLKGPSQPGFSSWSPPEYELEVRFPKGNRYPHQAPLVAFSTNDESVGAAGRLCVTERLFEEAVAAASCSEPVVYTLITLCEDERRMKELLAVSHHKYSSPLPVVGPPQPSPAVAKSKSVESRNNSTTSRRAPLTNHTATERESTQAFLTLTVSVVIFDPVQSSLFVSKRRRRRSWTRTWRSGPSRSRAKATST